MESSKLLAVVVIAIFGGFMIFAVTMLPEFGSYQNKDVSDYYLNNALDETGSANVVNSIVWDYRSYDTLGEETVLIIATIGIVLIVERKIRGT